MGVLVPSYHPRRGLVRRPHCPGSQYRFHRPHPAQHRYPRSWKTHGPNPHHPACHGRQQQQQPHAWLPRPRTFLYCVTNRLSGPETLCGARQTPGQHSRAGTHISRTRSSHLESGSPAARPRPPRWPPRSSVRSGLEAQSAQWLRMVEHEHMMHAMRRHVQDMAHGTCPRQRVLRGAPRAAARRQPRSPPPARAPAAAAHPRAQIYL